MNCYAVNKISRPPPIPFYLGIPELETEENAHCCHLLSFLCVLAGLLCHVKLLGGGRVIVIFIQVCAWTLGCPCHRLVKILTLGTFCILFKPSFPGGSVVKNMPKYLPANTGDTGSVLGWGRSPGEGNGNPLQYSCLGNPTDRGAWQTAVHGVSKSQTEFNSINNSSKPRQPSLRIQFT